MKTVLALLCLAALSACATSRYDRNSMAYKQCDYEAQKATPTTSSPIADTMRELDLIDQCMKLKGY